MFLIQTSHFSFSETVAKVKNCGLLLGCYGDLLAVDGIRNVSSKYS